MLYWLYEHFHINLLQYISVRAGVAFFLALCLTLLAMPRFIRWAQRTSSVQPINDYAPDRHREKAKTPTMGGVVFIMSTLLASLITIRYDNFFALGGMLVLGLFMLIGFKDEIGRAHV